MPNLSIRRELTLIAGTIFILWLLARYTAASTILPYLLGAWIRPETAPVFFIFSVAVTASLVFRLYQPAFR